MIVTILMRRCRRLWQKNRAMCVSVLLFATAGILLYTGATTLPEHDPFWVDGHEQFRVSAKFTCSGVMCFLFAAMILVWDMDRRWRRRRK